MIQLQDIGVVLLLVFMEGLLSADNAIVLAVLALPLPQEDQKKALRYGMWGAFGFRIIAVLLAVQLLKTPWMKLFGGMYLAYLAIKHFHEKIMHGENIDHAAKKERKPLFGLSIFWSTVIAIELTDIVFSVDSILVAVAMSPKLWVIIIGGILGIIAMRFVAGGFLKLLKRYPLLVDAAYIVVLWIGITLIAEFLNPEEAAVFVRHIPPSFQIPDSLHSRMEFQKFDRMLMMKGEMSIDERQMLMNVSQDTAYQEAVMKLYRRSQVELINWRIPKWLKFSVIGIVFLGAFLFNVRKERKKKLTDELIKDLEGNSSLEDETEEDEGDED